MYSPLYVRAGVSLSQSRQNVMGIQNDQLKSDLFLSFEKIIRSKFFVHLDSSGSIHKPGQIFTLGTSLPSHPFWLYSAYLYVNKGR